MNRAFIIFFVFFLIFLTQSQTFGYNENELSAYEDYECVVRLKNGDIITGVITDVFNSENEGLGIKIITELGKATIYNNQIADVRIKDEYYRHNHRVFLLPTANPIKNNHFVGSFELLFLYLGAGISDFFSITAGRTIVPQVTSSQQISLINAKFTFLTMEFDSVARMVSLALGGNLGFANHNNRFQHLYVVSTIKLYKTELTGSVYYKVGSDDFNFIIYGNNMQELKYPNGSFGLGLGIDTEIPRMKGLHFIGELWNIDVERPTNTALMLGLRLCNTAVSADFGLALFTQPYIFPFVSFVWTPF
ncbi:MAG: hypothetical protein N2319_05155 [Candidatus Kapabacteria bacterium]|nr:hypothetical protein [Candidatus Kapabacteria bacterium]